MWDFIDELDTRGPFVVGERGLAMIDHPVGGDGGVRYHDECLDRLGMVAAQIVGLGATANDIVTSAVLGAHAALGDHGETMTVCVRKGTKVYLVLEVMIIELAGIDATRPWYDKGGFNRLTYA